MAAKNVLRQSIYFPDEGRCVDIFRRPDGACGFEEFRRDIEEAALREARSKVPWLDEVLKGG